MATVYNWVVSQMNEKPQDGSLIDVVTTIYWRREATLYFEKNTYFADTYGIYACPTPSQTDYTAYPDLTFEQVCSWLESGLDVTSLNAQLDSKIEQQINPPAVTLPLPWAIPTPDTSGTSGTSGTTGTDGTSGTSGI